MKLSLTGKISLIIISLYLLLGLVAATGFGFQEAFVVQNEKTFESPSTQFLFGTDIFGRSVLARAVHGINTALIVGFFASAIAVLLGTSLGAAAGYSRGKTDGFILWIMTSIDSIPPILLLVSLSYVLGPSLQTLCIILGLTSWVSQARLIRAEFIRQRDREYVQAEIALGASRWRIITASILPNTLHVILINFSLSFVSAIKNEVILSYLGLGVKPGSPSWGLMISDAKLELSRGVWWGLTAATLMMFFLILAFTLFNDALKDSLDPKRRYTDVITDQN